MRRPIIFSVVLLVSLLALSQSPTNSARTSSKTEQEEQFQVRRQNFESGRQLLQQKGVPFNPDELLRDEWSTDLKAKLDAMPEMHETRYEKAPLKGVYLADTLYLPEKVQLTGHTLILANYVVFGGKSPVIKGNFDLHFFPTKPVTVLGDTLAQVLQKRPGLLKVKLGSKPALPSFALIKDLVQPQPHLITFDTSGPEPEWRRRPPSRPRPNVRPVAWNRFASIVQSGNQDASGSAGATGQPGSFGTNGIAGNSPGKSPSGSCGGSVNGVGGVPGENGGDGTAGGNGGNGGLGGNAGVLNITVVDGDINAYNYIANGGDGGLGGTGGDGGNGGDGGRGGDGGDGVACGCTVGNGGDASHGGNGGNGNLAGNGGNGGNGGAGGTITVSLPWNSTGPGKVSVTGGTGGLSGPGGHGGSGGSGGSAGTPGQGASACGVSGATGDINFPGSPGNGGNSGNAGTQNGVNGANGSYTISRRAQPPPAGCMVVSPGTGQVRTPVNGCSPIIIDTEGEGFHLTSALSGVFFDITGTGQPVQIGWTDSHYHNAFLALPGADGLVHSGKELFGDFTAQPPSPHPNGFLALAEYDKPENGGNGDGIIDDQDAVFSKLRLWIDENHDGICQPNELHRLPEFGIYSLALKYEESRWSDQFGNQFRYRGRVNPGARRDPRDETPTGQPGRWEYDVFFVPR